MARHLQTVKIYREMNSENECATCEANELDQRSSTCRRFDETSCRARLMTKHNCTKALEEFLSRHDENSCQISSLWQFEFNCETKKVAHKKTPRNEWVWHFFQQPLGLCWTLKEKVWSKFSVNYFCMLKSTFKSHIFTLKLLCMLFLFIFDRNMQNGLTSFTFIHFWFSLRLFIRRPKNIFLILCIHK